MTNIRAVGMAIYTYSVVEQRAEELWSWIESVERWSGKEFEEYYFTPAAKRVSGPKRLAHHNRLALVDRLRTENPWFAWGIAWPTLEKRIHLVGGVQISVKSRPQPERGKERYRAPSCVFLHTHADLLKASLTQATAFTALGIQLWRAIDGVYGFIDVETGIPLQDNLLRNAIHLFDSTVPLELNNEFRQWQRLMPVLNRRVWKSFWGNFLGAEHLQRLGGIEELQRADPQRRMLPEYREQAQIAGLRRLEECACLQRVEPLSSGSVLTTLSESPMEWFEPKVQARAKQLQNTLSTLTMEL